MVYVWCGSVCGMCVCVWCGGLQCDGVCVVWICVWCGSVCGVCLCIWCGVCVWCGDLCVVNINSFYAGFLSFLNHAVEHEFISQVM